ncbi:hypothetical protein ABEB36_012155 [Hypothenemus hampei]|uniref:DUF4817 domain-containing protein n=1 Tax=Hypothenemus hampei TaxID=57062 RepID=A0ABD1EAG0_HYPHA
MVYTLQQRTEIIFIYGECGRCARRTAEIFNERNPNTNVKHKYVLKLVAKFTETGSVGNKKRVQMCVLDEAAQIEVLGSFVAEPTTSLRSMARQVGMSHETVRKALKFHKFHPYKMQMLQQLFDDNFDRRIQFCETMTNLINDNRNILQNICFSDECTFFLNGRVNKQNCRYWSDENLRLFRENNTQYPEKVNVWEGILGNAVLGPLFMEENLTGERYLNLLEEIIDSLITTNLENQVDAAGNRVCNKIFIFNKMELHHTIFFLLDSRYTTDFLENGLVEEDQLSGHRDRPI